MPPLETRTPAARALGARPSSEPLRRSAERTSNSPAWARTVPGPPPPAAVVLIAYDHRPWTSVTWSVAPWRPAGSRPRAKGRGRS